jgi:hypothetical protein
VYGPIEYQGLGIPNLYTSQGISHIERILKYSHIDDDITGQLIRASRGTTQARDRCNGPTYLRTVCRFFQASDQLLDPADMAIYGCTPDPDRGHTPDFY